MAQLFLFLLFLLTYFTGALAQFTMTQPPSLSVSPGETVSITCTRAGGSISDHYVSWYQQKPDTKILAVIYDFSSRPSGIPERFSGSIDSSSNSATLSISNVQPEDEADYYCLSYDSNFQWIFGGGTQLIVTGQDPVSPSVQVFAPSEQEIKTQKKATLVCLLSGFHPSPFTLKWKVDGTETTSGVETTKPTKQGDKYLASSYLTRSDSDYGDHTYVCEVIHNGKTFTKALTGSGSC